MKKFSEIKEDFTDWIIGATKEDFLNVVIIYSKRLGLIALGFVLALIVNVIFSTPVEGTEEYKTLNSLYESSKEYGESLNEKVTELKKSIKDLEEENSLLTKKVEEDAPWFEMKEEERKAEEERIAQEKAQKEAEEKAKKEAEEKAAAEKKAQEEAAAKEAEAHKYETGLTWEDIAREGKIGTLGQFEGKIIQVMNGNGYTQYRVAINGNYDTIMLVEIDDSIKTETLLENDYIYFKGSSAGNMTYTTVLGAEMTIPAFIVDEVTR